ncbi:MAG TPA: DUF1549 and DUF1553 domain-containing protein [Verrucomicrobiae bacterium]
MSLRLNSIFLLMLLFTAQFSTASDSSSTDHWSLKPIVRPAIPSVKENARAQTPIDHFILAKLEKNGLALSPPAEKRLLLRRIYFDLIGLPPTPREMENFIDDNRPEAIPEVVNRLLESPHYGERWARHWLDVVHYAETHGHDQDRPRTNAWPYRDYVIASFNNDKPYRRFIEEQIAGDFLFPRAPEATIALGFLATGPWDESSLRDIREDSTDRQVARYIDRDDIVTTALNTFTSTTVQCARCHDHKFDPVSLKEYYGLQAVFAGTEKGDRYYDSPPDVHERRQRLLKQNRALENRAPEFLAESMGTEFQQRVAQWERAELEAVLFWKPLKPIEAKGKTQITLRLRHNDTINSRGPTVETNSYHVTLAAGEAGITALKLETLTDEVFPADGPGRAASGNFHLTNVRIRFATDGATNDVKIESVAADFNQEGYGIEKAIDDDPKSGWGIYPQVSRAHAAVFTFAEPTPSTGRLMVELDQNHGGYHLIARFRFLAATSNPSAHIKVLPEQISDTLRTARDERCECEDEDLTWFVANILIQNELAGLPVPKLVYAGAHEFVRDVSHKPIGKVRPVHVLRRGELKLAGELAHPGALSCISGFIANFDPEDIKDEGARRAALAKWISDDRNVLTWRSIVNRVWQYHFGRGIVGTPNDFGKMGEAPSHPELLDWLAIWFQENGGSFKKLHRLIMLSAVYQQSSAFNPECSARDGENRLLWRMNPTRLDAESVRDAILAISGKLDPQMGGPSVQQFVMTPGIHVTPNVDYSSFDVDSAASYRRSIYRFVFRTLPDPMMEALDCPDGSQLTPTRNSSVTVLQALAMWNNRFLIRQSEHFAERLAKEVPNDIPGQVELACKLMFQRTPSAEEKYELLAFVGKNGLPNLCRVLLNSNEFMFVQ